MQLFGIFFSEMHGHCHYSTSAASEGVKGSDAWVRVCIKNEAVFWSNFVNKSTCSHGADGVCRTLTSSRSEAGAVWGLFSGRGRLESWSEAEPQRCSCVGVWLLHPYERKTDTAFVLNNNYARCSAPKPALWDNRAKPGNHFPRGIAGCLTITIAMRSTFCRWECSQTSNILLQFYSPPATLSAR